MSKVDTSRNNWRGCQTHENERLYLNSFENWDSGQDMMMWWWNTNSMVFPWVYNIYTIVDK